MLISKALINKKGTKAFQSKAPCFTNSKSTHKKNLLLKAPEPGLYDLPKYKPGQSFKFEHFKNHE